ncbi:MAG: ABC transporter permease [Clostridia bacterium]|nr:ABC transporter permease [Clostridia bacterium]
MKLKKNRWSAVVPFLGLFLVLAALGAATGGQLFQATNFSRILDQCYTIVILAVGCSFIYAHGGFDLAVGAVYGLSQMIAGLYVLRFGGVWMALALCVAMSLLCYAIMGVVTIRLNLPAFISSLCMQFLCRGIITATVSENLVLPSALAAADSWMVKLAVLAVLLLSACILMTYTVFGRNNKAIGENPVAARQSGINNSRTRLLAYLYCALLVGIAAFFAMCRTRTVATLAGSGYEMDVIFAIVLGGMSLNGGIFSSVRAPIIGALIITVLANGLVMIGVPYTYIDGISGAMFLIVVALTYKRSRNGLMPR